MKRLEIEFIFLDKTEIPTSRIDDYPEYFSGGQQQRIQISKALSSNPKYYF